jgi:hypothetical protein
MKFRSLYVLGRKGVTLRYPFLAGLPSPYSLYHSIDFLVRVPVVCVILFVGIVSCPFARVTRYRDTLFSRSLAITCNPPAMTCVSIPPTALGYSCMFGTGTDSHIGDLALWVHPSFPLFPDDTMDRLFKNKNKNKRKKSPEPLQPGIPTNIADRPPGFPTELGIGSKGGRSLSYRDR